jgi:hypothetical protein
MASASALYALQREAMAESWLAAAASTHEWLHGVSLEIPSAGNKH